MTLVQEPMIQAKSSFLTPFYFLIIRVFIFSLIHSNEISRFDLVIVDFKKIVSFLEIIFPNKKQVVSLKIVI